MLALVWRVSIRGPCAIITPGAIRFGPHPLGLGYSQVTTEERVVPGNSEVVDRGHYDFRGLLPEWTYIICGAYHSRL